MNPPQCFVTIIWCILISSIVVATKTIIINGRTFDEFNSDVFKETDINEVFINACTITKIKPDAFSKLTKLNKLSITATTIRSFPAGLFANNPNLNQISMDATTITDLDVAAFQNLNAVTTITFSASSFGDMKANMLKGSTNLNEFTCKACGAANIDLQAFNGLDNLKNLYLQSDCIKEFIFGKLPVLGSLETLDLQGDPLKNFDVTDLQKNAPKLNSITISKDVDLPSDTESKLKGYSVTLKTVDTRLATCSSCMNSYSMWILIIAFIYLTIIQ